MNLINREKSSHWYQVTESGQVVPFYEVPNKSKGGMRPVTIKDAREVGAMPSVTTILSVLNKPGLNDWRVEQAIKAALTLPRERESIEEWSSRYVQSGSPLDWVNWAYHNPPRPLLGDDEHAKRIVSDSEQESDTAKSFGTQIHDAIDDWMAERKMPPEPLLPYLESFMAWEQENIKQVIFTEKCVHSSFGYAGRLDMLAELHGGDLAVFDFKTQKVRNGKAAFYPEWALQLASYSNCQEVNVERSLVNAERSFPSKPPALISIVIDSSKPGTVHTKLWEKPIEHLDMFLSCFELWKYLKGYEI